MKLVDAKASIISFPEFREWRQTGIAFEVRESTYIAANRSLASMAAGRENGRSVAKRGYWGDIVNSPYISFGIECDDQSLMKKQNDTHLHSCQEVCQYNVSNILRRLLLEHSAVPAKQSSISPPSHVANDPSATTVEADVVAQTRHSSASEGNCFVSQVDPVHSDALSCSKVESALADVRKLSISREEDTAPGHDGGDDGRKPFDGVRIYLLTGDIPKHLVGRKQYAGLFHHIYLGNTSAHFANPDLTALLADDSRVSVESAKFMLDVFGKGSKEFASKVAGLGKAAGWTHQNDLDSAFLHFKYSRQKVLAENS
mmetsp:Transcript_23668/g.38936  ORF Transcript_23668/g.38936 Transcript_23668/m.38936 type:complete len:314 (-) Transcript_23668:649-1590(-)